MHFHYVCPLCTFESCPNDKPTSGAWLTHAETHMAEEHPCEQEEPKLERRGCPNS